jgi:hypothetical protein
MRFKTKDLLVTVLPAAVDKDLVKVCLLHTVICKFPTHQCGNGCTIRVTCYCSVHPSVCQFCSNHPTICQFCSNHPTICQICSFHASGGCQFFASCGPGGSACDATVVCPGGSQDPFVIQHMEDLVALRAELQETLKQLDVMQKEGLPSSIGSKAEADALEQSLTAALEQVRAAKKNLK